mgnify:CR=1 FL=1
MIQPIDFDYFLTPYFWMTLLIAFVGSMALVRKHGS